MKKIYDLMTLYPGICRFFNIEGSALQDPTLAAHVENYFSRFHLSLSEDGKEVIWHNHAKSTNKDKKCLRYTWVNSELINKDHNTPDGYSLNLVPEKLRKSTDEDTLHTLGVCTSFSFSVKSSLNNTLLYLKTKQALAIIQDSTSNTVEPNPTIRPAENSIKRNSLNLQKCFNLNNNNSSVPVSRIFKNNMIIVSILRRDPNIEKATEIIKQTISEIIHK